MLRTLPLSIISSFSLYTQQWYVIQLESRIRTELQFRPDPARKLSANLYVLLCVQWKTPDDEQRNSPKHVEFYSKNRLEKLVHLVGFIIRIYHDARSPKRQIIIIIIYLCLLLLLLYSAVMPYWNNKINQLKHKIEY